ncbi:S24/S26 family peptidase [Faecalicatena contorta]|uniref:S24/S26 family peptidase n=1 Tax=Faecalicatena contorta TaxID=39482 RepID=UPI001F2FBD16|nr:S24/S26 family peptidase [Faecalicatena contorta]MCF2682337.1 S24/S26 family peptidase [Faecalicatena contorta]
MKILETEAYIDTLVDMVEQGNEVLLVVVGHSMEPFLVHERDQVLLSPITREVRKGDIILYQRENGQYILHRICRIRADGYDLVGDNQNLCDIEGPIQRKQMRAIVRKARRNGKEVQEGDLLWRIFQKEWLRLIRWRRYLKKMLYIRHLIRKGRA